MSLLFRRLCGYHRRATCRSSEPLLAAVLTLAGLSPAQAQPSSSASSAPDPLQLSPFEVRAETDSGYRVGAAITGTGTAGLINDTPLNISVVSSELIKDQASNQLVDVLRAASSVALHVKDEGFILVRGYPGPQFVNGLPAGQGLSLYDVDRIEVVKGPNAVFAGISNPGGTVNLIKYKPAFTSRHTIDASYGSFDHRRIVLRSTAPLLKDQLAYQLIHGRTDEGSYIDHMGTKEDFYSGGLTWRPLPTLTFTGRYSKLDREAGRRPHVVVSHPLFQARDREAIEHFDRLGLPRPGAYPQLENGAVVTSGGQPIQTGRTAPETVDTFIARTLGRDVPPYTDIFNADFFGRDTANYNGPEGRDNYRNQTTTLEGEWVPSRELAFRAIYQQVDSSRLRREYNGLRPVAGQRLRSAASDFKPGGLAFAARFEAAATRDLRTAGNHNLLLGFQHDGAKDVVSPITIGTTRVVTYNPRSDPEPRLLQLLREQYGAGYEEPGVIRKGGGHTNAYYSVLQSAFFEDRVRTLLGGRHVSNFRPTDDDRDGRDVDFRTSRFLPQAAALVRVTPGVSLYGSVSETFVPQRQQTADLAAIRATHGDPTSPGYRPPAVIPFQFLVADLQGRGWEGGAKLDFIEGRLLGTISYFSNQESARLDNDTFNQVLYQLPGATVRAAAGETRTKGVETEWVWAPGPNYETLFSASYFFTKEEVSNPSDPREIGSQLEAVPRYTAHWWNKYTFASGPLRGAYIGGGATALGPIGVHPNWTVRIETEPVVTFDALVGYAMKIRRNVVDFRVNVRNVADKHYLNGTFQYGEPRRISGTVGVRF